MIADDLIMLSEDDARHDAIVAVLEKNPKIAYAAFLRVLKNNERNSREQAGRFQRITTLQAKRRDWVSFNQPVQRALDRGEEVHKDTLKRFESNKAKIASADKELAALRAEKPIPSLSAEMLADALLESKGEFIEVGWPQVKLPKGQSPEEALAESRANREAMIRDRNARKTALVSFDAAAKRIEADVRAKATAPDFRPTAKIKAQYTEKGNRLRDAQGHVQWPKQEEYLDGGRTADFELGVGMLCWLFEKEIVARGVAELKSTYGGEKGLSDEERAQEIARIEAEILAEERREEALVRMCEDAGIEVYRRPLANPLAVLGIAPKS